MHDVKVVIVEDELIAAEFLREILEAHGVEVLDTVDTGKEAIEVCTALQPDAVFMDVMLRDRISGSEAAVAISERCDTKIIFLTAYTDPEMVDYAVAARAAGYLTKPYNEAQIVATLRLALAQRPVRVPGPAESKEGPVPLVGGLVYDRKRQRLLKAGREVELGAKALKLVDALCRQPDVSISNEQLAAEVWGEAVNDKTLRSLIFRIRKMTHDDLIRNVSGTGYKIVSGE